MIDINKGIALLLTRGRPATNLPRFFRAAKATGMTIPGYVIVDHDDYGRNQEDYDALDLPDNWSVHVVTGGSCAAATEEAREELFTSDMQWLAWIADDLIPETPEWDRLAIESLTGFNVVSTNDGKFAPQKLNGFTVWSADLVRAVGYLYPPGFKHFYIDNVWEDIAKLMGIWQCRMDIMVRHAHASWTGGPDATLIHTNSFWDFDESAYLNWKNDDFIEACNRVGELLISCGVSEPLPDLSGIKVMIATPSGSGKFERLFMASLHQTIEALRQCGAVVNFAEMSYCSDISLARAKIFGLFLRSDYTHLMSIDDDMGWRACDVIRLFSHKRDFVAAAGPRKVFPASFAVQHTDAKGRALPLLQEATTGLFEVSSIGFAFALVTHALCERVAKAHPELEFAGDDGRVEYAVFNPIVVNRRYKSEDFAFCERWRGLGGKIYVDPAISLQHVGSYVWSGDWLSHLVSQANDQLKAA